MRHFKFTDMRRQDVYKRQVYDAKTEMWELGGIYFSRYLGLDADGFYLSLIHI